VVVVVVVVVVVAAAVVVVVVVSGKEELKFAGEGEEAGYGCFLEFTLERSPCLATNASCPDCPLSFVPIVSSLGSELAADEFDGASQADDGQEAVILSYVVGMLTNFKTLPLERVHNMLKMFVTEPPYNKKIQELQAILDKLVSEEKLEVDGGNYTLKQA
jgi:hypothetical protein